MLSITIVDFCAYRDIHNEYVVKELCIADVKHQRYFNWIFNTPDNIILDTKTDYEKIHGSKVSDGTYEYAYIPTLLKDWAERSDFIFCKGQEKSFYLEKLIDDFRPVHDLSTFGAPPIKKIVKQFQHSVGAVMCQHHQNLGSSSLECSQLKSECSAEWVRHHLPWVNLMDTNPRLQTFNTTSWKRRADGEFPSTLDLALRGFYKYRKADNIVQCVYCYELHTEYSAMQHQCVRSRGKM
uniref:Uncharacterized protein n=1 Tax=Lygus hesperus TaxID=30085 RepID=A0A0A9ZHQ1_LYGHE